MCLWQVHIAVAQVVDNRTNLVAGKHSRKTQLKEGPSGQGQILVKARRSRCLRLSVNSRIA